MPARVEHIINLKQSIMKRQRIKKQGAVRVGTGYCPKVVALWAVVVAGTMIMRDVKENCEDACIALRMKNVPAEVVKA